MISGMQCSAHPDEPARFAEILGPDIAVLLQPLDQCQGRLAPVERQQVARAVIKRRREFIGGRTCARKLLDRYGVRGCALPRNPDGAPVWPEGYTGSISHRDGLCLVAVAPRKRVRALGVDIETWRALRRGCWPEVFTAAEQRWLHSLDPPLCEAAAKVLFSAKESAFKCQYTLTGRRPHPRDIEVTMRHGAPAFRARCPGGRSVTIDGFALPSSRRVITAAVVATGV